MHSTMHMSAFYSSLLAYFLDIYPVLRVNCSQLVVCVMCPFPYLNWESMELGRVMFGHCAIFNVVKIQVGLKMKDAGCRCYPESESME